jgi:hypothetical protein
MSSFSVVMLSGWTATFVMFGLCALQESGEFTAIRRRMARWLEGSPAAPITLAQNELAE